MANTSIWDISLNTANLMYAWGTSIGTVAALVAAIAGFTAFWASGVRDKHSTEQIESARSTAELARQSTATLEAETEKLKAKNIELQMQLEEQQQRRLELEKSLGPRSLSPMQRSFLKESLARSMSLGQPDKPTVLVYFAKEAECISYSQQLISALQEAGVSVEIDRTQKLTITNAPNTGLRFLKTLGPGSEAVEASLKSAGLPNIVFASVKPTAAAIRNTFDHRKYAGYLMVFPKPPGI